VLTLEAGLREGREAQLAGDPWTAVEIFEALAAQDSTNAEVQYWLASAKLTSGDPDGAARAMEDARILHALPLLAGLDQDPIRCRTDPVHAANIAMGLYASSLVAISGVVRALSLSAGHVDADGLLNYGLALQHQGRPEEAREVFKMTAEKAPVAEIAQFVLFPTLFCDDGEARFTQETKAWVDRYVPKVPAPRLSNPPAAGRRLRIGYVAPTFAGSQLRQYMTPLLESHDPAVVDITLYPADANDDAGWPDWIKVHPIGHLSDADAAALIRNDGIDVLADCWGHTADSRLNVFARRAAPVQVTWINSSYTTAVEQIDYILHADSDLVHPEGSYTEEIWPIGPVYTAFRAAQGRLPSVSTPALASGLLTFGSFNHPAKLNDWVLDAWAGVLRSTPGSRLLLKYKYFRDPVLQRVTQARFAARGVAPERIVFEGHTTGDAYFSAFRKVDLMLDAWPFAGSTTTLDALSNGVPVLTMAGPASQGGDYARSLLMGCDLPELVTDNPEAFVERALELTEDLGRLDALRARVRPAFEGGRFCDEVGFTRRVEQAFSEMFARWEAQADGRASTLGATR
jgi:tetratricopeptide (TPR) repeat protein